MLILDNIIHYLQLDAPIINIVSVCFILVPKTNRKLLLPFGTHLQLFNPVSVNSVFLVVQLAGD